MYWRRKKQMFKKLRFSALGLAAAMAVAVPTVSLARDHDGGRGGRGFARQEYRGGDHDRGRDWDRGRSFYRDYDHDRGWGFGVYVNPAPAPVANGYYDQYGVWHPYAYDQYGNPIPYGY